MTNPQTYLSQIQPLIGTPCHVELHGTKRGCYVFDWSQRTEMMMMIFQDTFGDGAPDGFQMEDDDTLLPFATIGMYGPDDDEGQPEGILFFDLSSGAIVHIEVDGTALIDSLETLADSFSALPLRTGRAPDEDA